MTSLCIVFHVLEASISLRILLSALGHRGLVCWPPRRPQYGAAGRAQRRWPQDDALLQRAQRRRALLPPLERALDAVLHGMQHAPLCTSCTPSLRRTLHTPVTCGARLCGGRLCACKGHRLRSGHLHSGRPQRDQRCRRRHERAPAAGLHHRCPLGPPCMAHMSCVHVAYALQEHTDAALA